MTGELAKIWDSLEEPNKTYTARSEYQCAGVQATIGTLILKDSAGIELFRHELNPPFVHEVFPAGTQPQKDSNGQPELLDTHIIVPTAYVPQMNSIIALGGFKRLWTHGVKKTSDTAATLQKDEKRK